VILGYFTKFTEAIIMPNIEEKIAAEIFVMEVVTSSKYLLHFISIREPNIQAPTIYNEMAKIPKSD
jgi:hypothetical protein